MGTTWHINSECSDDQQAVRDAFKAAEKVDPGGSRRVSGYGKAGEEAFFAALSKARTKSGR